jgi:hypothetical protein
VFSAAPDLEFYDFPPFVIWRKKHPLLARAFTERGLADLYLRALEADAWRQGRRALFWKLLTHHFIEHPFMVDLITGRGYRVIYLTRGAVRQVLSGLVAKQRGRFNSREAVEDSGKYTIDLEEFRWHVEWERKCVKDDRKFLRDNQFDFLEVDYETYLADRRLFFARIFGFLGLPEVLPEQSTFKVMIDDLSATIANYAEVWAVAKELGEPLGGEPPPASGQVVAPDQAASAGRDGAEG